MLLSLPYELIAHISCYLSPAALLALARSCSMMLPLLTDPYLWKWRYQLAFPACPTEAKLLKSEKNIDYMSLYRMSYDMRDVFNAGEEEIREVRAMIADDFSRITKFVPGITPTSSKITQRYFCCDYILAMPPFELVDKYLSGASLEIRYFCSPPSYISNIKLHLTVYPDRNHVGEITLSSEKPLAQQLFDIMDNLFQDFRPRETCAFLPKKIVEDNKMYFNEI